VSALPEPPNDAPPPPLPPVEPMLAPDAPVRPPPPGPAELVAAAELVAVLIAVDRADVAPCPLGRTGKATGLPSLGPTVRLVRATGPAPVWAMAWPATAIASSAARNIDRDGT